MVPKRDSRIDWVKRAWRRSSGDERSSRGPVFACAACAALALTFGTLQSGCDRPASPGSAPSQTSHTQTDEPVIFTHTARFRTAAFSPAGDLIVTTSSDATILWSVDGTRVAERPLRRSRAILFSPDGSRVLVVGDDGLHRLLVVPDLAEVLLDTAGVEMFDEFRFSSDGQTLVGLGGILATPGRRRGFAEVVLSWDSRTGAIRARSDNIAESIACAVGERSLAVDHESGQHAVLRATAETPCDADCLDRMLVTEVALHWNGAETPSATVARDAIERDDRELSPLDLTVCPRHFAIAPQGQVAVLVMPMGETVVASSTGWMQLPTALAFQRVDFVSDTEVLFSGWDGLALWDLEASDFIWSREVRGDRVFFSQDYGTILVRAFSGDGALFDRRGEAHGAHDFGGGLMAMSPDGRLVAIRLEDNQMMVAPLVREPLVRDVDGS